MMGYGLNVMSTAVLTASIMAPAAVAHASLQSKHEAGFAAQHPGTGMLHTEDGRLHRIYGRAFAHGGSPADTATRFIEQWSSLYGVPGEQLIPGGLDSGRIHLQPILYEADRDDYRFTGVYYQQAVDGIAVHGARLLVLVRNEPGFPAVLAGSDLKPLGDWQPRGHQVVPSDESALAVAERFFGAPAELVAPPRWLVFAGGEDELLEPRLVQRVEAMTGSRSDGSYRRWLLLADAETGAVLYDENRVLNCFPAGTPTAIAALGGGDISGIVEGWVTTSSGADACEPESIEPLPYLRVTGDDGSWAYADEFGAFTLPTDSGESLQLSSELTGRFFRVENQAGANAILTQGGVDGDTVDFLHNPGVEEEYVLAQVNAYLQVNRVRDYVLQFNPDYPVIRDQTEFPTNVNLDSSCNAYYDYSSTNYYVRSGGCNNTAFSSVVHHEYGHHLVACAGSGQGEYGEGMGDVMSVLLTLDPYLGRGFFEGQCSTGIRNADNNCQYSTSCSTCGSAIHSCGQLISGCVWSTRQQLLGSTPGGHAVISSLAINAMLLHTGTSINESIVVDYLTLDDDDDDLGNGSPHYAEIAAGFGEHGIDAPPLDYLNFSFPDGLPEAASPDGTTSVRFTVASNLSEFLTGSQQVWIDSGQGLQQADVQETSPGEYRFSFPASACGTTMRYYFRAQTTDGQFVFNPADWPSTLYSAYSAYGVDVAIDDHFDSDQGWYTSGTSSTPWTRSAPQETNGSWRPDTDFDGGGFCYHITQPELDGTAILTSPAIDAGAGGTLEFAFWLGERVNNPAQPEDGMQLLVSTNNGGDWTLVRDWNTYATEWRTDAIVIGPDGEVPASSSLRLRFVAVDEDVDNRVSVAVDAFEMIAIDCKPGPCPPDFNGDATVGVDDLLWLIGAWGGPDGDLDGSGATGVDDLLLLIQSWGPCV